MSEAWIQTYTGLKFDFIDLKPEMVCIEDIAHSLSNQCRYNGHCTQFYSVAEHSVNVAMLVAQTHPEFMLEALMHDAAEAYIGDMVSPLKAIMPEYKLLEHRVEWTIAQRFALRFPLPEIIKKADLQLLVDEKQQLHSHPAKYQWPSEVGLTPNPRKLAFLGPVGAEAMFMHFFRRASQSRSWSGQGIMK